MDQYKKKFKTYIDRIVKELPTKAPQELVRFVQQFYDKTPLVELESWDPSHACAVAHSAYDFMKERTPKKPKIRIFSPSKSDYGWKSEKTVIEILCDDRPFLVDSISAELTRQDLTTYTHLHPVLSVVRDKTGKLKSVKERADSVTRRGKDDDAHAESFMHIQVGALPEEITPETLSHDILRILHAVDLSVRDWRAILAKVPMNVGIIENAPASFKTEDIIEVRDFLNWLAANNFVFLGYVEYDFHQGKKKFSVSSVPGSALGLFQMDDDELKPKGLSNLPSKVLQNALTPELVEVTKANMKSPVHRPIHMDYVSIKRFDKKGRVVGENRFLGMFTSRVYYQSADDIPVLRRKIARIMERANFDGISHNGKALKAIMEFYPRDELFQTAEDDLFQTAMGILSLDAKPDVRLFVRKDIYERYVSCMIYVPRERYSTYLREKIQATLEQAYEGKLTAHYAQVTDSPLARIHFVVKTRPGQLPEVNLKKIEAEIARVTNLWSDSLLEALIEKFGDRRAERFFRVYKNAFPANYVTHYGTDSAVYDIQKIDEAATSGNLALDLFRKKQDAANFIRLKVYNPKDQVPLSDILPMLENMGFRVLDENPYNITPRDQANASIWVRDLRLTTDYLSEMDVEGLKPLFEEALAKVWRGSMENDGLNALVMRAGLPWRNIVLLRAYSKYLKQTGLPYNQDFITQALMTYPHIANKLVELFHAKFNPENSKKKAATAVETSQSITKMLAGVSNLAHDRVLRLFLNVIESTLRTNFFQNNAEGKLKDYVSFKLNSQKVAELPLPRPFREIFVYSMRVEGIHLRGGKVARGGLRWSDRHEDFRTEVLGLMKAQMVKNAIIVPVGSKGGFVVKRPPAAGNRETFMEEGINCYRIFLQGLLDITDNIVKGKIVPPQQVVRYDEDDPYLVVAADKGTATFSDIANKVSLEYGFWLGDAFASGGSAGYDHKKMAITARGGWISVEGHFRALGKDISKEDFTAIGIGDMAGDVFGNGMLLSKNIKLVAVFNHLHIFLDPAPDSGKSFKERQRLFNLPRSSWADYEKKLISKGGGVYSRSDKTIPVSKEVRQALGITSDVSSISPDEMVKAILKAPVDLLWNGGIGTYVKAKTESNEEVGDRSNNSVRINGEDLRCKIVGEGGNLGFTQRGRIEYARKGGRINTDALDNSAGVDCSDHEVNIKIAFSAALEKGKITVEKRDKILVEMTEDVAQLVLRDNSLQNQALTNAEVQGHHILESRARVIRSMERSGLLNREIEFLPNEEELAERRVKKQGFTRPELAVILAYSKLALYEEILQSSLPDDVYFKKDLMAYFPQAMQNKFQEEITTHALRREIVATVITNSMINRVGSAFFLTMAEDNNVSTCDVARAFTVARDAFELRSLWEDIEEAGHHVSAKIQAEMFVEINLFVERITGWFLRNFPQPIHLSEAMKQFEPGIKEFMALSNHIASDTIRKAAQRKLERFLQMGVSKELAQRISDLEMLSSACDVVRVALATRMPVRAVSQIYFELGHRLRLGWLRMATERINVDSHWNRIAATAIINDLFDQQRRLTLEIIHGMAKQDDSTTAVEKWQAKHAKQLGKLNHFMADLQTVEQLDFSMLVVAMRNIDALCAEETKKNVA